MEKNSKVQLSNKMEEDYNWDLILKVSVTFSIIEAYIFYTNINNYWKWSALAMGLFLTGLLVNIYDKRKQNMFTAIGIVFLTALILRFLKNFGVF